MKFEIGNTVKVIKNNGFGHEVGTIGVVKDLYANYVCVSRDVKDVEGIPKTYNLWHTESELELYEEEFPEKWWIYPETISEIEAVSKWFDKNHSNSNNDFYYNQKCKTGYTNAYNKGYVYYEEKPEGVLEITFDQFKKHILKESTTMKNLLKTEFVIENCTLSQRLAIKAYCDEKKIRIYEDSFNLRSCKSYPNLRFDKTHFVDTTNLNAKIITFSELIQFLDQYQPEPEFKVGDFIYYDGDSHKAGPYLLKEKISDGVFKDSNNGTRSIKESKGAYRHATPEEIKKWKEENEIKLPKIDCYSGEHSTTNLKWGCTIISISTIKELLELGLDHITIKGYHIVDSEIEKIRKFIEHNKL